MITTNAFGHAPHMNGALILILSDVAIEAAWWQVLLDNALALTVLLIFVTAIIVALLNAWQRDKCLKLMHDYHVTYLTTAGRPTWGDLIVYSRGIELRFDAPYVTRRGTSKSSALVYDDEMPNCLAICRVSTALTRNESRGRIKQITRTFKPSLLRRGGRMLRNTANTLRDAVAKSVTAILGQLAKTKPGLAGGKGEVEQLGKSILGTVENTYEPMLEKHIGRPVILQLNNPEQPDAAVIELPGYLVDYSDKYVAVFNVEHSAVHSTNVEVSGATEQTGFRIEPADKNITIHATGPDTLIVRSASIADRRFDLDVILLPGCRLTLPTPGADRVSLTLERTQQLDVVCPRSIARVYFGSDQPTTADADSGRQGLAPDEAV